MKLPLRFLLIYLDMGVQPAFLHRTGAKPYMALIDPVTKPADLGRPGHIFPLRAKNGGVLRRAGHTEAAVDLARLAGFKPGGVLVEIMNDDGTMARLPQLIEVARKFDFKDHFNKRPDRIQDKK